MQTNEQIKEILDEFSEYLATDEAKKLHNVVEKEKKDVLELMNKLSSMDENSEEFTDWVLYGLLPHTKTSVAKRVSIYNAFFNIKAFFKDYDYSESEWNLIAKRVFSLCRGFQENPKNLPDLIKEFTKDKYSRRLQCGTITPILFCINNEFPVVNNRVRGAYRDINLLMGSNDRLSQKLNDYLDNIEKINDFIKLLDSELFKDLAIFDLFCYWFDKFYSTEKLESIGTTKEIEIIQEEDYDQRERLSEVNIEILLDIADFKKIQKREMDSLSLSDPHKIKIKDIIGRCENNKWVLPHFQRYFDWNRTNIKELWESIFYNYYIGSFLLWETSENLEVGVQPINGVSEDITHFKSDSIILDGQQRITSLYYAIKAPSFNIKYSKKRLFYYINFYSYFMPENNDGVIRILDKKLDRQKTFEHLLFPLFELEDYSDWISCFTDFYTEKCDDAKKIKKYFDLANAISNKLKGIWNGYEVPYITLPKHLNLAQVTEVFERINTRGKILNIFDLLIARLYKYEINLKVLWDSTKREYPNIVRYFEVNDKLPNYILQIISLLYEKNNLCARKDLLDLYTNIYDKSDRVFEVDWRDISKELDNSIKFLEDKKDGFGVNDEKHIPFAPMIPVITALRTVIEKRKDKGQCYKKLKKWYWSAVFKNAYSFAADSQMINDFREVKKWFDDDSDVPKVVKRMRNDLDNYHSLYLKEINSTWSAKYRGILSLLALEGAKDFISEQVVGNIKEYDKDHIFPKSSFSFQHGENQYKNSILNITWLEDKTNRIIKKGKKPSEYVKEINKNRKDSKEDSLIKLMNTHFITKKAYKFMLEDDFMAFIDEREKTIMNKLRTILDVDVQQTTSDSILLTKETPFSSKLAFISTLKICNDYIYWLDKYFSTKGFEYLIDALPESNVKDIKIIMAPEKVDEQFKSDYQKFKTEVAYKGIATEIRVICESKIKCAIHDRFIINRDSAFNIPSPDIVARGQLAEISKSDNQEELEKYFEKIWENSLELISGWQKIMHAKTIK